MNVLKKLKRASKKTKLIHINLKGKNFCLKQTKPYEFSLKEELVSDNSDGTSNATCLKCINEFDRYLNFMDYVASVAQIGASAQDWFEQYNE